MNQVKLALLHGFAGSPRSWERTLQSLPAAYDTIAPPLFGHDPSTCALDIARFDDEVDRLAQMLQGSAAWLCGYSLGGRLALRMLIRHPAQFAGAILVSASPGLRSEGERAQRVAEDKRWIAMLRERGVRVFAERWQAQPIWQTQKSVDQGRLQEQNAIRIQHSAEGLARAMSVLGLGAMPDSWNAISDLSRPIRWLTGALDQKFCAIAREACAIHQQSSHRLLDGMGHNPLIEDPAALAAAIDASVEEMNHG